MCHQASFHLKFARKYPLLALKLPENWVILKPEAVKKGKKRVHRLTETKPKYRNKTEILERNIKIIGKHIQVYSLPKRSLNFFKRKNKIIVYRYICLKKEDMGDQLKAVELPKGTLIKLPKRTLRSIESS